MTTTPGMSPSPTHDGVLGGQYRVVEWVPTDGGGFKARMTGTIGVSKATAEAESTRLAATTGGVYMAHPAGPLKPPAAPKAARQPKPKVIVYGRGRRDLVGKSVEEKAAILYPSTEIVIHADGTATVCSPVSGEEYTINERGECSCPAPRRCWHQASLAIRVKEGRK